MTPRHTHAARRHTARRRGARHAVRAVVAVALTTALTAGLLGTVPAVASEGSAPDVPGTESVDVSAVAPAGAPAPDADGSTKTVPLPDPQWPVAGDVTEVPVATGEEPAADRDGPAASTETPDSAPDELTVTSLGKLSESSHGGMGAAWTVTAPTTTPTGSDDPAAGADPGSGGTVGTPGQDTAAALWDRARDPLGFVFADDPTPTPEPSGSADPAPDPTDEQDPDPEQGPEDPDGDDPGTGDPQGQVDVYEAPVQLELSYKDFAGAVGGDWSSRLRAVLLTGCATVDGELECTGSEPLPSLNDTEDNTVTVTLDPDLYTGQVGLPAPQPGQPGDKEQDDSGPVTPVEPSSLKTATTSQTAVGLTAGPESDQGTYSATPLSLGSTWSSGGHTGDFSWSYPFSVPANQDGPTPDVGLSYSSGSVDGRTSSSNNQTSRIGEGFDLDPGFIERSYAPCKDDVYNGSDNSPEDSTELCWKDNNLTISLNGKSSRLVPLNSDGLRWRLEQHDGTIVERKGTMPNINDRSGTPEYWVVTSPDGTKYWYGAHNDSDGARVNTGQSTSTVRVYGNNSSEPCHSTAHVDSWCKQAWRWGLDYVQDPTGGTMSYFWDQEKNFYGAEGGAVGSQYDRGARFLRVEYGNTLKRDKEDKQAPYRVTFEQDGRCTLTKQLVGTGGSTTVPNCEVGDLDEDTAKYWPDVPYDQLCATASTPCADNESPTFFTLYRTSTVKSWVTNAAGNGYENTQKWVLNHSFPQTGDGTTRTLWLGNIEHIAVAGAPAVTLPTTSFVGTQLPNRVDTTGEGIAPFVKWRVASIRNGLGGTVNVNYNTGNRCQYADLPDPKTVDDNPRMCFPSYYQPDFAEDPQVEFFHKYVVTSVVEADQRGGAPNKVTKYRYVGDPAWKFDESNIPNLNERTWSDWRGYKRVETEVGGAGERTFAETVYLRGLDGDRELDANGNLKTLTDGSPDRRNFKSTDGVDGTDPWNPAVASSSPTITDHAETAGFVRRTTTRLGNGGTPVERVINTPWVGDVVEAVSSTKESRATGTARTNTGTFNADGTLDRTATVDTTFDPHGRPVAVTDNGDTSTTTDDRCAVTGYADPAPASAKSAWQNRAVRAGAATETTVSGACVGGDLPTVAEAGVISATRTYYDGHGGLTDTPTRGLVTKTQSVEAWGPANTPTFRTDTTTAHETERWRPSSVTAYPDSDQPATTASTYIDDTNGLTTGTEVSNALEHKTITTFDRLSGQPSVSTDPMGRQTKYAYDAAGRVAKVWAPGNTDTDKPTAKFTYSLVNDGSDYTNVTTETLNTAGDYVTSRVFYDGLLRERAKQAPAANPEGGRVVTETWYDSRGQVESVRGPYYNSVEVPGAGDAKTTTLLRAKPSEIPSYTDTTYDKAGRVVRTALKSSGETVNQTTTSYDGSTTSVDPPDGATPVATQTDARGQTVKRWQYKGAAPTGPADQTTYEYTPAGKLSKVTDPAGTAWEWAYDVRGHEKTAVDPDKGTTTSQYDALDRLKSTTDAENQTLTTSYDELGRKTSLATTKPSEVIAESGAIAEIHVPLSTWTYDTITKPGATSISVPGQLVASTRTVPTGTGDNPLAGTYTDKVTGFDATLGLPTSTATVINPDATSGTVAALAGTYKTSMTYFANGQPKQVVQPSTTGFGVVNETLNYTYDRLDQPRTLTGAGTIVADTSYTPFGQVAQRTLGTEVGRSVYDTYEYDPATARLQRHWAVRQTATSAPVIDLNYAYDDAGVITSINDTTPGDEFNQCFDHDYLQRITQAYSSASTTCASGATSPDVGTGAAAYRDQFSYDLTGNRTSWVKTRGAPGSQDIDSHAYAYAPAVQDRHQLDSVMVAGDNPSTETFGYDSLGNTVSRTKSQGGSQTITWDPEGHQATVAVTGGGTSRYAYDTSGTRLFRHSEVSGQNTTTLYLGDTEYTTKQAGSALTKSLVRNYTAGGKPTASRTSTGLEATISDHNDTPLVTVTDNAAQTFTKRRYDPFGSGLTDTDFPTDRGYLNKATDVTTATTHLGAREYDPGLGRFISVDAILDANDPQQMNGYAYANNSPIVMADPTGLRTTCSDYGAACSDGPSPKEFTEAEKYGSGFAPGKAPTDHENRKYPNGRILPKPERRLPVNLHPYAGNGPSLKQLGASLLHSLTFGETRDACGKDLTSGSCVGNGVLDVGSLAASIFTGGGSTAARTALTVGKTVENADDIADSAKVADAAKRADEAAQVLKGPIADAVPKNLPQQLALGAAKDGHGDIIMRNLADAPRLVANYGDGNWVKMQYVLRGNESSVTMHYFRNLTTKMDVEFKFK